MLGLPSELSMDDGNNLVDHVGDVVLDTQVAQGYDIGDGVSLNHTILW